MSLSHGRSSVGLRKLSIVRPHGRSLLARSAVLVVLAAALWVSAARGAPNGNGNGAPAKPAPAQNATPGVVQAYTVDASDQITQETLTNNATPGDIQLVIKNLLPKSVTTYSLTVDVETMRVVPPVLPSPGGVGAVSNPPTCKELITVYNGQLASSSTETQVADVGRNLSALTTSSQSPCTAAGDKTAATDALSAFQTATTVTSDKLSIQAGQRLIFTLIRNGNGAVPQETIGHYVISTAPEPSQWLVFYGANFINDHDQKYYAKANAGSSPATYTVTPQSSGGGKVFAPSVSFMWLPAENFQCNAWRDPGSCIGRALAWRGQNSDVFGGVNAGLGFGTNGDTSNPVAFLGYAVGWGYNVMVSAGVAMHQEKRLVGQYQPGQVISENLTPDQLAQNVYKPSFFIGLQFRFGSNPFSSSKSGSSSTPTTPQSGNATQKKAGS